MLKAIYPGTFDPITLGHVNIIERAAKLFEKLVIGVAVSEQKKPLFTLNERMLLVQEATQHIPRVEVAPLKGLLVDFSKRHQASCIVRGIRTTSDFEFEYQLASMNRKLSDDIETLFLTPLDAYSSLSSSLIREIAALKGNITPFVPANVDIALQKKFIKE